nr:chaperone NapD [Ferrimonas balearica]
MQTTFRQQSVFFDLRRFFVRLPPRGYIDLIALFSLWVCEVSHRRGRVSNEYHISSFVVHCLPDDIRGVRRAIGAMEGSEVHACTDDGKMVVTLERDNRTDMQVAMEALATLSGVLSASLTYHRVEAPDEPRENQ